MDFRRIPFQFSTTDPLKRQEELQRRFGLPVNKGNMYVDFSNPGAMGIRPDNSSASNSPRLQHRVPIFVEGQSEPIKPSVDAQNVDSLRKPHVRVIPIEIEGEDNTNKKHRWLSGSSEPIKERVNSTFIPVETKHSAKDSSPQFSKPPRVCNIPIKIENSDQLVQPKSPVKTQKVKMPESPKHTRVKQNGCSASKVARVNEKSKSSKANEKRDSLEEVTLRKIQIIEEKLKGYHIDVEKFSGTTKEKQYRYLDEMLTRCMLELDEIDTMGLDTIRLARKAAIKKVQASIDLLESKIIKEDSKQGQVLKEPMEVESSAVQTLENTDIKIGETEENKKSDVVLAETNIDEKFDTEAGSAVTDMLPEQMNEKIENITIMETEEAALKPNEKELLPVQITEIDAAGDNIVTSEIEPVIEEPLSDSKDENTIDMDLDNCNCESDLKLDKPSCVQICEVEEDADSCLNKLETGTSEQLDENLKIEVIETSSNPVVTVFSNDNIQVTAGIDESSAAVQSVISGYNNDS